MAEYDAFGRKIGEDPLEHAGWGSEGAAPSPPVPVPVPVAGAPPPPAPPAPVVGVGGFSQAPAPPLHRRPARTSRARPLVGLVALTFALAVVGGLVYAISAGMDAIEDATTGITPQAPQLAPETPAGAPEAPASEEEPAAGIARGSLIRRAGFARAIARLREEDLGGVFNLRVAADRIDAQVLGGGGRLHSLQILPNGELHELTVAGSGFGHLPTTPLSEIDTRAPERLARAAAERLNVSTARVDYLVMLRLGDGPTWSVFFKNGTQFQADASGRIQRRVN